MPKTLLYFSLRCFNSLSHLLVFEFSTKFQVCEHPGLTRNHLLAKSIDIYVNIGIVFIYMTRFLTKNTYSKLLRFTLIFVLFDLKFISQCYLTLCRFGYKIRFEICAYSDGPRSGWRFFFSALIYEM